MFVNMSEWHLLKKYMLNYIRLNSFLVFITTEIATSIHQIASLPTEITFPYFISFAI